MKYYFAWGNNIVRAPLKRKPCKVICRGKRNSCMLEFEDEFRIITSRNSIRKIKK